MGAVSGVGDGSRWTPRRLLIAAVHGLRRSRYGSARRAIDLAIASSSESDSQGRILLAAACTLFVTGDYGRALDCAAKAALVEPQLLSSATELGVVIAELLGWDQEARAILSRALEADPCGASWLARLVRVLVRAGALEEAIVHARRALELEPHSPGMALELARLLALTGRYEAAIAAVERALQLAPAGVPRYWRGAADIFLDAGALGAAEGALLQAQNLAPGEAAIELELAELALWRGNVEEAESHRQAAALLGPELPASWRIRGSCAALAGEWSRAAADFDRAIKGDPDDYVAYTWRAEAAYRLADLEGARDLLDRAIGRVPGYHPAAWMIRFLVYAAEEGEALADEAITEAECAEFRDALCEIVPEARAHFDAAGSRRQLVAFIDRALLDARGNRDMRLTFQTGTETKNGEPMRVRTRSAARYASRQALRQIRGRPPAKVLEALDRVVDRFPHSSLPICHRGELHFWLGDLEAGRRDLEAALAINPYTRWAYIGLTGIEIAEGKLRRALQISAEGVRMMGNTEGPAVFVYRAEAERLLG
ncbi:MAG TPA: tetratricopeptide repeat protein, partial [Nannocystis exedens]|nr:tetratricopeptide repeat protein [Nannocystis exedens]